MKMVRRCAAAMQAARFNDVRRSSSMIPSFTVLSGNPSSRSTAANTSTVNAVSSLPWSLGLTT